MYPEEEYKPLINLTSEQLAQIKDWEVGETHTVTLEIKQKSKSEDEFKGKKYISSSFEIVSIKAEKEEQRLNVLRVVSHREYKILLQWITPDFFQAIVFYHDNFYQHYMIIFPEEGKDKLEPKEVADVAFMLEAGGIAIIEELEKQRLGDKYVPAIKDTEKADVIVKALEHAKDEQEKELLNKMN